MNIKKELHIDQFIIDKKLLDLHYKSYPVTEIKKSDISLELGDNIFVDESYRRPIVISRAGTMRLIAAPKDWNKYESLSIECSLLTTYNVKKLDPRNYVTVNVQLPSPPSRPFNNNSRPRTYAQRYR